MSDLELILVKDGKDFSLYACRGEGKGCKRNRYRISKKQCEDCKGPLPEDMTLEQVQRELAKGDG